LVLFPGPDFYVFHSSPAVGSKRFPNPSLQQHVFLEPSLGATELQRTHRSFFLPEALPVRSPIVRWFLFNGIVFPFPCLPGFFFLAGIGKAQCRISLPYGCPTGPWCCLPWPRSPFWPAGVPLPPQSERTLTWFPLHPVSLTNSFSPPPAGVGYLLPWLSPRHPPSWRFS